MLEISKISMKNFFSFGNAPQVIELDLNEIILVLGQNNDASKEDDAGERRNGVGKSALIQGIVFALYGKSIGNDIKIPNLVNKTNQKNCEVEVEFKKDGVSYRVERGRNPTYFNFLTLNEKGEEIDDSRGEKKDTQEDLEEILGISQLLFEYIVVMNANVEPFLGLGAQKQRDMVEELLGITQLTEKAERLKEMCKENVKQHQRLKFENDTITESNARIEKSIEALQKQAEEFDYQKNIRIDKLKEQLKDFDGIDFEELFSLASKMEYNIQKNKDRERLVQEFNELAIKCESYDNTLAQKKYEILSEIDKMQNIDIAAEIAKHERIEVLAENRRKRWELTTIKTRNSNRINELNSDIDKNAVLLGIETEKLISLDENKCPLCKNNIACEDTSIKEQILESISLLEEAIVTSANECDRLTSENEEIVIPPDEMNPETFYSSISDAKLHEHKLNELIKQSEIQEENIYVNDLLACSDKLEASPVIEVVNTLSTFDVNTLKMNRDNINAAISREMSTVNQFWSQIETLKETSIKTVDWTEYNDVVRLAEHQDFLVKLLMNKDSFIRKRIIDQNILYLNSRLEHYIEKVGSQHQVEFMNDLSVSINLRERSYDFKQLSRGERTRVVIALNMAFRDVHEVTNSPINILCCDELVDNGLDSSGIEMVWNIFKEFCQEKDKTVLLISHREELHNKAKNILLVTKEDDFSSMEFIDPSAL